MTRNERVLVAIGELSEEYVFEANLSGYRKTGRGVSKLKTGLIAAVIVFSLMIAAFAVSKSWNSFLANYFKTEEKDILDLDQATMFPSASAEADGITVNVLQTLTDAYGVYVLYEMYTPNAISLSDNVIWAGKALIFESDSFHVANLSEEILQQDEHYRLALICYRSTKKVASGGIRLQLSGLYTLNQNKNGIPEPIALSTETWEMAWEFKYKDCGKTINYGADGSDPLKVYISPLSLCIWYSDELAMLDHITIGYCDGTKEVLETKSVMSIPKSAEALNEGEIRYFSWEFGEIKDLSLIEFVQIGSEKVFIHQQ